MNAIKHLDRKIIAKPLFTCLILFDCFVKF
jgi:hypothetical protein